MKAGAEEDAHKPLGRAWPGIALLAFAALLVVLPPVNGIPVFGYAAIAAVLIGAIAAADENRALGVRAARALS